MLVTLLLTTLKAFFAWPERTLAAAAPTAAAAAAGATIVVAVIHRVWAPKVNALSAWRCTTQQHPQAFSLLFSSVASLLGSAGQANYAAANAALDAAAVAECARGVSACSIRWGAWAGEEAAIGVNML
jgi:hypothetical protein